MSEIDKPINVDLSKLEVTETKEFIPWQFTFSSDLNMFGPNGKVPVPGQLFCFECYDLDITEDGTVNIKARLKVIKHA